MLPDDPSSVTRTHVKEGENWLLWVVPSPTYFVVHTNMYGCTLNKGLKMFLKQFKIRGLSQSIV